MGVDCWCVITLILNGLLVPAPFVLQKLVPKWERQSRLLLIGCDTTFDISFILINIMHSSEMEFMEETWWVATAGVVVPAAGIVLLVLDLFDFAITTSVGKRQRPAERKMKQNELSTKRLALF